MTNKQKLRYFVAKTEFKKDRTKCPQSENRRIACAERHFGELGEVEFVEATILEDAKRQTTS